MIYVLLFVKFYDCCQNNNVMCKSISCQKNSFAKMHLVGELLILIITKDNTTQYAYATFLVSYISVHGGIDRDVSFFNLKKPFQRFCYKIQP